MLVRRGRLELDRDVRMWIHEALEMARVEMLPLDPDSAIDAADLMPGVPGDPADRMIAAIALRQRAPLVTKDRQLQAFPRLQTVW